MLLGVTAAETDAEAVVEADTPREIDAVGKALALCVPTPLAVPESVFVTLLVGDDDIVPVSVGLGVMTGVLDGGGEVEAEAPRVIEALPVPVPAGVPAGVFVALLERVRVLDNDGVPVASGVPVRVPVALGEPVTADEGVPAIVREADVDATEPNGVFVPVGTAVADGDAGMSCTLSAGVPTQVLVDASPE